MIFTLFSGLLRKKNRPEPASAAHLLAAQNVHRGMTSTLVATLLVMLLWVYIALLFDRYFPWFSVVQGLLIGLTMQRFGRGLDWRFPLLAAALTAAAAVLGSFLVALFLTGREFGTGALSLVDEISVHTIATFLTRDFGVVGTIYLVFAAALAAFFANRRLLAGEAAALRRHRIAQSPDNT
jgi:hypothetical protein